MLPPDYRNIVASGLAALDWLQGQLRDRAAREHAADAVWLDLRNAESLEFRLINNDDWSWQTGFAGIMSSPQDLGVLDAFARQCEELSPYRRDSVALTYAEHLRSLRAFLARYQAREFAFEDPNVYPHVENPAPAG